MHTVVETPSYLSAARAAGIDDQLRADIVGMVADNPGLGDVLEGTGGFRKFRVARPGGGKSGGYRVVTYYWADDIPVFLITVFAKNQRANLTQAERNELKKLSSRIVETYRQRRPER